MAENAAIAIPQKHAVVKALPAALTIALTALIYDPTATTYAAAKAPLLALGALFAVLAAAVFGPRHSSSRLTDRVTGGAIVLLAWAALSLIWTPSRAIGLEDLMLFACGAALFTSGRALESSRAAQIAVAGSAALSGFVASVTALVQRLGGADTLAGTIGNPNHLAAYAAATAPLAIWLLWYRAGRALEPRMGRAASVTIRASACALAGGAALAAILFTGCQSAVAGLAASVVFLLPRSGTPSPSRWRSRWLYAAVAVSLALVVVAGASLVNRRFRRNFKGRTYLARITTRLLTQKPAHGHGLGAYALRFPAAQARYLEQNPGHNAYWTNAHSAHCEPLGLAAELGLVGVVLCLLFGWALLKAFPKPPDTASGDGRRPPTFRSAAAGCLAVVGVCSLAESTLHQPPLLALAAIMLAFLAPLPAVASPPDNESKRDTGARAATVWPQTLFLAALAFASAYGLFLFGQRFRADRLLGQAFKVKDPRPRFSLLKQAEHAAMRKGRIRFYLGLTLLEMGRPEPALKMLRRSLTDFPNLGTHLAIGNALMATGRTGQAERAFRTATWLNPRYAAAHHNLAVALKKLGRFSEARQSMRRAQRIWPGRRLGPAHTTPPAGVDPDMFDLPEGPDSR